MLRDLGKVGVRFPRLVCEMVELVEVASRRPVLAWPVLATVASLIMASCSPVQQAKPGQVEPREAETALTEVLPIQILIAITPVSDTTITEMHGEAALGQIDGLMGVSYDGDTREFIFVSNGQVHVAQDAEISWLSGFGGAIENAEGMYVWDGASRQWLTATPVESLADGAFVWEAGGKQLVRVDGELTWITAITAADEEKGTVITLSDGSQREWKDGLWVQEGLFFPENPLSTVESDYYMCTYDQIKSGEMEAMLKEDPEIQGWLDPNNHPEILYPTDVGGEVLANTVVERSGGQWTYLVGAGGDYSNLVFEKGVESNWIQFTGKSVLCEDPFGYKYWTAGIVYFYRDEQGGKHAQLGFDTTYWDSYLNVEGFRDYVASIYSPDGSRAPLLLGPVISVSADLKPLKTERPAKEFLEDGLNEPREELLTSFQTFTEPDWTLFGRTVTRGGPLGRRFGVLGWVLQRVMVCV